MYLGARCALVETQFWLVPGLVLPILGALPDALIIYQSGQGGSNESIKEQVALGIGALAGEALHLKVITVQFELTSAPSDWMLMPKCRVK